MLPGSGPTRCMRLRKPRVSRHCSAFSQAQMAALWLRVLGSRPAQRMRVWRPRANCHCPTFTQ
eukprot:9589882-Lingulodinium_polyedra.AAC.1